MEASIEEVKVLQSVTLLLTTNTVVHGETLAKVIDMIKKKQIQIVNGNYTLRLWCFVSVYILQKIPQR